MCMQCVAQRAPYAIGGLVTQRGLAWRARRRTERVSREAPGAAPRPVDA